ncbi:rhomboid family integral membrane protein [Ligilactobacillus apodemi DSM 16634 = JCM 16172]|uniref:Rhomboid family integral membrane protein n=1 Tax=Ligilactobacillus apodemi DSM 16634 = JCM 16172 TaxID=1423724 RepID=A0A0R1TQG9_9LACO|nr:rhomboid family integral membrane protein [Ligilactobacillus apodemi DSM 16634 = JCM 16172]
MITINLLVFIGMTLSGGSENVANLIRWGAKYNPLIIQGEWWRLVTPMFIHIGLEHLALNMLTLYFLGIQLEQLFGKWRYLVLYLVSGIGGNIFSFALSNNVSAGASTALFGLFGAYLMLGESFRHNQYIRMISRQFLVLVVLNFAFDLFTGGIDMWGHAGGLFAGFLASYLVGVPKLGNIPKLKRILSALALVIVYGLLLKTGFNN